MARPLWSTVRSAVHGEGRFIEMDGSEMTDPTVVDLLDLPFDTDPSGTRIVLPGRVGRERVVAGIGRIVGGEIEARWFLRRRPGPGAGSRLLGAA